MNDNYITVITSGFTKDFPVLITKGNETKGSSTNINDLANYIIYTANNENISQIKIIGNTKFVEPIVEEIKNLEYSNNNLEIEVISE